MNKYFYYVTRFVHIALQRTRYANVGSFKGSAYQYKITFAVPFGEGIELKKASFVRHSIGIVIQIQEGSDAK